MIILIICLIILMFCLIDFIYCLVNLIFRLIDLIIFAECVDFVLLISLIVSGLVKIQNLAGLVFSTPPNTRIFEK